LHFNIAHKIFGIALFVLILMAAVAVYSIQLTAKISASLDRVTHVILPITDKVESINFRILEKGILLQRLFALEAEEAPARVLKRNQDRFDVLGQEIDDAFQTIEVSFDTNSDARLQDRIKAIGTRYGDFNLHGRKLLKAHAAGDRAKYDGLLVDLNTHQDKLNNETEAFRQTIQKLSEEAVDRATRDEQFLLMINSALTACATVLAILFSGLVTRTLVRSVRNLVGGTEAIERGELDIEVKATSDDEVGQLTRSFNHMVGELRLKERIKDTFGKYMDPRIVSNLLEHPEFTEPGGERREMTVMFIDLKGFTSISEALGPDDLVRLINRFFEYVSQAISDNSGVVDKYMGDAVMAYWGSPFCEPDEHAALACKAVSQLQQSFEKFRQDALEGIDTGGKDLDVDFRIGISTGDVIVGTVGSKVSMNFTVMGDPVNLGARLEGANKAYGTKVLVSERTRDLAGDAAAVREIDLIRVKGKEKPTRIFELVEDEDGTSKLPAQALAHFEDGVGHYRQQKWQEAEAAFSACQELVPDDPPSQAYRVRLARIRDAPPPANWDGVWNFTDK